jgi:hypothetical protein
VKQRQISLDRLVIVAVPRDHVAVESIGPIARNAKLDRPQPLDPERPSNVAISLVAALGRLSEEHSYLRVHHLLERLPNPIAYVFDDFAQSFSRRRLEPTR